MNKQNKFLFKEMGLFISIIAISPVIFYLVVATSITQIIALFVGGIVIIIFLVCIFTKVLEIISNK